MKILDGYIIPVKGEYLKKLGNEEILQKYLNDFDDNKTYWIFQNNLPEDKQKMFDLFEKTSTTVTLNDDPSTENEYKFDVNYGRDINTSVSGQTKSVNELLKNMNSNHFDPSDWDKVKRFFKRSDDDIVYSNNVIYANIPSVKISTIEIKPDHTSNKVIKDIDTSEYLFKIGLNDRNKTFTLSSTSSALGQAVRLKNNYYGSDEKVNFNESKFEYPIDEKGVKDAIVSAVQFLNYALANKEEEDARKEEIKARNKGVNEFKNKINYIVNSIAEKFMDLVKFKFKEFEKEKNRPIEMSIFKRDFNFNTINEKKLSANTLELKNYYGIRVTNIPDEEEIKVASAYAAKNINEKLFAKPSFRYEIADRRHSNEDPITPYDEYIYYKIDIEKYIEDYDDFFNNKDNMQSNFDKSTSPSNLPGVTVIDPENKDNLSDEEYIKAYEKLNEEYENALLKGLTTKFDRWVVPYEKVYYVNKGEGSSQTKELNKYYYKLNTNDVNILNKFVYARMKRKNGYRRYKYKTVYVDILTSWVLGDLSDDTFEKFALKKSLDEDNTESELTLDSMNFDNINSSPESYIVKNSLSEQELVESTIGAWLESKPWLEGEPECYYNKDFDDYRISFTYNPGVVLDDLEEFESMMMDDLKGLNVIDYDIFYDDELDKEYAAVVIEVTRDNLIEDDYE